MESMNQYLKFELQTVFGLSDETVIAQLKNCLKELDNHITQ